MEGISTAVYRGIRGYWRRKAYERLSGGRNRKVRVIRLGSDGGDRPARRRRFWRIKLLPRLRLRVRFSPKKLLLGLRDAYVGMMMKIANSAAVGGGYGGYPAAGFGVRPLKEYDERMIVEIYKSIVVAQGQLVPRDAAWIGSEITCRR
ncbi:mitochondrial carrier family protein [Striga asiatica]|uniref:Mitochondrial carrier family protein n=1 Tax=Striga asiatica TaxID=4170 RepID=A0A5A7QBX5_STRAF|nr:mitochondrial carrier family protein [Striga asiatica]